MDENRKYVIVSNEHTTWNAPGLLLWGQRTDDDAERRSFGGYTYDMNECEMYTYSDLAKFRMGVEKHYPFFEELSIKSASDFRKIPEVLCTLDELRSIGYGVKSLIVPV